MTDKEMLMLAYGALKAQNYNGCKELVEIIEKYLFPQPIIFVEEPRPLK